MQHLAVLLILLCGVMSFVTPVFPKFGLFFATPAKKTRLRGIAFWALALWCAFGMFGLSADGANAPTALIIVFGLSAVALFVFAYKLCSGGKPNEVVKWPADHHAPNVPVKADEPVEACEVVIPSHSDKNKEYHLNLTLLTCTCPDWQAIRVNAPEGHPSRLCKHLVEQFSRKPVAVPAHLQPYLAIIRERGRDYRGFPAQREGYFVEYGEFKGKPCIIEASENSPWVNVYYDGTRYGYSMEEKRWARGDEPKSASSWVKMIHTMLRNAANQ